MKDPRLERGSDYLLKMYDRNKTRLRKAIANTIVTAVGGKPALLGAWVPDSSFI
jgi:hypothetical protein